MTDQQQESDPADAATPEGGGTDPSRPASLTRDDLGTSRVASGSKARLALLAVGILIVGIVIGRVTAPEDSTSDSASGGGGPDTTEGLPFPTGDVNRTGYWGFVDLTPVAIDTFDRANSATSLGTAGSGQTWEAVSGTWGIDEDSAATSGGGQDGPNLAVIPRGTGDGLTEVTMTVVEGGAGLVFRYLDPDNYWSVTANPGVGSWSVNRVIDGDDELVGELTGPTASGVTVSVVADGTAVRFLLDGVEYLSITDGALADQLQGGLIASAGTANAARWDRFLVEKFSDEDSSATTVTTAG